MYDLFPFFVSNKEDNGKHQSPNRSRETPTETQWRGFRTDLKNNLHGRYRRHFMMMTWTMLCPRSRVRTGDSYLVYRRNIYHFPAWKEYLFHLSLTVDSGLLS